MFYTYALETPNYQLLNYNGIRKLAKTSIRADLIAIAREAVPFILLQKRNQDLYRLRLCWRLTLYMRELCLTRLPRCVLL